MGCPVNEPFRRFLASICLCASAYIFLKKKKGASTNADAQPSDSGASPTATNPLNRPAEETCLEAPASTATVPEDINFAERWKFGPSISLTSPDGSDSAEQEASGLLISPAGSDYADHWSFGPSNSSAAPEASNSAGDASYGPANPLNRPAEETGPEASASTATAPADINFGERWKFGPSTSLTSPAGSDYADHWSFGPSDSPATPEASSSAGDASYGPANLLNGPAEETGFEASSSTATTPAETNIAKRQSFGPSISLTSPETSNSTEDASSAPTNPLSFREPSNSGEADLGAPSSLTSKTEYKYDVFLSFRGPDTRTGFVDHLYQALVNVGAMPPELVFRDEENLPFGDHFPSALIDAVTHSKISIPVISENYASSEWCLRELILIMKAKKSRGQIVFPILYKVTPYDVRKLKGEFGKAFNLRKKDFKEEIVKEGPEVLQKVCKLKAFESDNHKYRREAELVREVVQLVLKEQQHYFRLHVSEHLVGADYHVEKIMRLADSDAFTDTRIIGIYGMGGVGKTTLAKIIYNNFSDKFVHRSFLKDIQKTSIHCLQSQLISDLLHSKYEVSRSGTEISILESTFKHKKVLILLDDVNNKDQLDGLIKDGKWFMSGSRIIFTSQDKIVLDQAMSQGYHGYELTEMNADDSLTLFSRHAFGRNFPPKKFGDLSRKIITFTGGLPIALKVIGDLLKTERKKGEWKEMLDKLKKTPPKEVREMLRISYDNLDNGEQEIFLDIACLLEGADARIATYMWDDCEFRPKMGIKKLIRRSLIKIGDNNELRMQGQLRDLGRRIVDQKRSRLWDGEEALNILRRPEGIKEIVALRLDRNGSSELFEQDRYKKLPNLRFLHISSVDFAKVTELFSQLRWLQWERCPDSFEATEIHLEKLLILELSSNTICENWGGWSSIKMAKLKVLNLSRCSRLRSTPNLSAFKSLEILILEHCEDLEKIDSSIGEVQGLISLNLRCCGSLEELPEEVSKLEKLKELLLDETNIQEIPPCIGSLKKLNMLSAVGCRLLTKIPRSIGSLVKLSTLNLDTCKRLPELPDSVQSLVELKRLSLVRCYMLKRIPSTIGKLKLLTELDLSSTGIMELPESIEELQNLEILRVSHSAIEKLPSAVGKLGKLQELDASGCHNLEEDILIDTRGLSCLKILRLGRARISGLPRDIQELSTLEHLDLLYCNRLKSLRALPSGLSFLQLTCQSPALPSLSHLSYLKELTLHICMSLESIPELPSKLLKLRVWKCHKLKTLPDLSNLESLSKLELLQCYSLMGIKGLKALKSLRTLNVSTGTELLDLDDFEDLESVRYLDLESYNGEAKNIELEGIDKLECLEVLNISERKSITKLDLSKSERLKRFIARNCESLAEIQGLNKLELLEELDISGCKSIVTLPDLAACKKLRILEVKCCEKLTEIRGLKPDIKVDYTGCKSMQTTWEDRFKVDIPKSKSMGTTRDRFKVDIPRSKSMGTTREDR